MDNAVALMSRLVIVYAYALKDRLHDRPLDIHDLAGMIDPEALQYSKFDFLFFLSSLTQLLVLCHPTRCVMCPLYTPECVSRLIRC